MCFELNVGGNWDNSADCGSRSANCNNASSNVNANNGSRRAVDTRKFLLKLYIVGAAIPRLNTSPCPKGKTHYEEVAPVSSGSESWCDLKQKGIQMRRHGNLWEKIISDENIVKALYNACKSNGRMSEEKKAKIKWIKENPDKALEDIKRILTSGEYKTSGYHIYPLYEPKLRLIYSLPFYPDRVIHHCILGILEPLWDGLMIYDSYACRKGKGQHQAGTKCGVLTKQYKYVAKLDIAQFYIAISHERMKEILREKIKDKKVLDLLDENVDSIATMQANIRYLNKMKKCGNGNKDIDKCLAKLYRYIEFNNNAPSGLPIGNYTSQWFGNLYMNKLDNYIKQELKCKNYIRYCDDFVIFSDSKEFLHSVCERIREYCAIELKLLLSKCAVFPTSQGVEFCGYRYFPQGYVLLKKNTAKRIKKRFRKLVYKFRNNEIDGETMLCQVSSTKGLLRWGTTHNLQKLICLENLDKEARVRAGKVKTVS